MEQVCYLYFEGKIAHHLVVASPKKVKLLIMRISFVLEFVTPSYPHIVTVMKCTSFCLSLSLSRSSVNHVADGEKSGSNMVCLLGINDHTPLGSFYEERGKKDLPCPFVGGKKKHPVANARKAAAAAAVAATKLLNGLSPHARGAQFLKGRVQLSTR